LNTVANVVMNFVNLGEGTLRQDPVACASYFFRVKVISTVTSTATAFPSFVPGLHGGAGNGPALAQVLAHIPYGSAPERPDEFIISNTCARGAAAAQGARIHYDRREPGRWRQRGVVGSGIAALLTRYLSAALLEVEPLHRLTFVLVDFGVLAIVLLASIAPARRAARVDLGSLLRAE
jgi:hypothetical protein